MGSTRTLRFALAATGLTLLSLSMTFNDAAAQAIDQPEAKAAQTNKNEVRTQQDQVLRDHLLVAYDTVLLHDSSTENEDKPELSASINAAIHALDQGANPNIHFKKSYNVLTPIEIAFVILKQSHGKNPNAISLIQKLLEKGADKRQITSSDVTVMYTAIFDFTETSNQTIEDRTRALDIIRSLYDLGFSYQDATHITKTHKLQKNLVDFVSDIRTLDALKKLSLVDDRTYERITIGNQKSRDAVRNNTHLTREILLQNGATISNIALPNPPIKTDLPSLNPGAVAKNREVDLVTVEARSEEMIDHHEVVFKTALQTAMAINPTVDTKNFHHLYEASFRQIRSDSSDIHSALFNNNGAEISNNIVYSTSQGSAETEEKLIEKNSRRSENANNFLAIRDSLDMQQKNKLIFFIANGNGWFSGSGRLGETTYITHGPRATTVGASADFRAKNMETERPMIAHYTSFAADICNRTPSFDGEINHGTSNATPALAATYRQMAEWYGDALSFEEIMAAGLMSADRNPWDFKNPGMFKDDKDHSVANNPANFEGQPAHYTSNGGGLPWHERCGAGVINPIAWNNTLQTMIDLKERHGLQATEIAAKFLPINSHEKIGRGRKVIHKYTFIVPEDMTLGRLTIAIPNATYIIATPFVTTPAGFQFRMPQSEAEIYSTYAFAYEDVKKGDVITIEGRGKMEQTGGIYIRGHKPGNSIAALRDFLQKNGTLPEPLRAMAGNTITGPATRISGAEYPEDPPTPSIPRP